MLAALHGNPLRLGNLGAPPRRLRGLQGLRAASVDKPNKKPSMRVVQELENSLKRMGVDKATAQRILAIWGKAGATSPDALRKLLLRRSASRSQQIAVQLLIDAAAGGGAFYAAAAMSSDELGAWTLAAKFGLYFLAMYFLIGAGFECFSLGAVLYATYKYSTNADAFLLAVQDIAGASSGGGGLSLVDRAKQAVNIVKVLQALDEIRDLLKGSAAESETFFSDLGVYLTLERAQRLYGFDAQRYGLGDAEAAQIAAVFARYDANDDGYLSPDEFRRLCAENRGAAGGTADLSEAEVTAAFELLDTDKSGTLDFGEWVEWWMQNSGGGGCSSGVQ